MSTENPSAFNTIAIIGLGLIGGSLARLIRHQTPQVRIFGLDQPSVVTQALVEGVLTDALTDLSDPRLHEADLIVIGTHPHQSYTLLQSLAELTTSTLTIMDLGSSKATICRIAESLPAHIQFIGGHPLAGREISGFDNSRWDLFFKKRFLLSTCARTPEPLLSQVESWLKTLGTIPIVVGAEDHDRLMALVSHFPQFYAIALANLLARNNPEEALNFLGGGIDDQMRLMISPFEIWHDVFEDNRAHMNTMLDQFIAILTQMKTDLNQDSLASWFETSHSIYHMYQEHKAAQYRVFSEN